MTSPPGEAYQRALDFWYRRVNFELATPLADDLKLDRIRALLALLGDPQDRLRILHVAGSKGKGSTSAMLESILRQAGYRTGLFTSPHLNRVEERIQVDHQPISTQELTALLNEIQHALSDRPLASDPTFFEIATAVGFLHFVRRRVDVAVIEVGLGGRFDSTNVCRPLFSIITSISLDHTRQLGDRLESIAMEKAGIVKSGRPVISGVRAAPARQVIEQTCRDRHAPLRQLGIDFRYQYEHGSVSRNAPAPGPAIQLPRIRVESSDLWPVQELGLLGEHQAANAAVAIACIEQLRAIGWSIGDAAVTRGLARVEWPARMEIVATRPLIVLDCAHNVVSMEAMVATLRDSFPPGRRLLVFGASADKDLLGMLRVLAGEFTHFYLTRYTSSARAALPEQLAELAIPLGVAVTVCDTPETALKAVRAQAQDDDLVGVTGSVFLAGEVRALLK